MSTLKKLKAELKRINREINRLNRAEEKKLLKEYQVLVGTCYRYPNSFGEGNDFWSYLQVVEVTGVWVTAVFERPSINIIGIQVDDHPDLYSIQREKGSLSIWEDNPIPYDDFMKAYKNVLRKVTPRRRFKSCREN